MGSMESLLREAKTAREVASLLKSEVVEAWAGIKPSYARHVRQGTKPLGATRTFARFVRSAGLTPQQVYDSLVEWYPEEFGGPEHPVPPTPRRRRLVDVE